MFQATSWSRGKPALVAHAEEVRGRVVVVVGGDEPRPGPALGRGPAARVLMQEQHPGAGAAAVGVEAGCSVHAPFVYLSDQAGERCHVRVVNSSPLVCDDVIEAMRLRLEKAGIGHHSHSMPAMAAKPAIGTGAHQAHVPEPEPRQPRPRIAGAI